MDNIFIKKIPKFKFAEIDLPASKSISNRLLIINFLNQNKTKILNLSKADDTQILLKALNQLNYKKKKYIFDMKNAGTSLRFLTAFLSFQNGVFYLKCDKRMEKRPIDELVKAINSLSGKIEYIKKKGFPPLKITGQKLTGNKVIISGKKSSQFISAIALVAPKMPNGLSIKITDKLNSTPYLKMTLDLLSEFGIKSTYSNDEIYIKNQNFIAPNKYFVESDWSAAAVWYAFVSLSEKSKIIFKNLSINSIQGDKKIAKIYEKLGVFTEFENSKVVIFNKKNAKKDFFSINLKDNPDLMPTLAVNLCLLGIKFKFSGLENLHIKESDRINAIIFCLKNFGYILKETSFGVLQWDGKKINKFYTNNIKTFNDHRIAMACSLFSVKNNLKIENYNCTEKSYPNYWKNLRKLNL